MSEEEYTPFCLGPENAESACLLIHGFMGNPQEMLGLGKLLAVRGIRVYGMVVAGHEGDMERFIRVGRKEWLA
jgi:carboxylesterase